MISPQSSNEIIVLRNSKSQILTKIPDFDESLDSVEHIRHDGAVAEWLKAAVR
jgi:hypothetical protein